MANNLTGDYEAVLEVSVRQLNGILATLHQHGGDAPDQFPHFPHSVENFRVGSPPKLLAPHVVEFSKWLGTAVQSLRAAGDPGFFASASPLEIGAHLAAKAPPGAVARISEGLRDLITARDEVAPTGRVRGLADLQLSTPAISLSGTEVVVHVYVRAHYHPESGTPPLPVPIHGEVRIYYQTVPKKIGGKNVLEIAPAAADNKILFFPAPGSGMSQATADAELVLHIRKAVRERFKATPVELPADFNLLEFKAVGSPGNLHDPHWVDALGTGGDQALALPMQLSGNPAPPGAIASVSNMFLGAGSSQSDFAIAVSKEYVAGQFAPTLVNLRQLTKSFEVPIPVWPDPTYHFSVTAVDLQFKSGFMDLIINAKATTRAFGFPDYNNIVITQRIRAALIGQTVSLRAADEDLTIIGLPSAAAVAKNEIIAERNKALPAAGKLFSEAFQKTLKQLSDGLKSFDESGSANYTAVEITPDGIVVRGAIETKWHYEPVLPPPGETDAGKSFTALHTWIPGGRIDRFRWSWWEAAAFTSSSGMSYAIPWEGKTESSGDLPHVFTFPKPAILQGQPLWASGVCLDIEGIQVLPDGTTRPVGARRGTCRSSAREPFVVLDPLTEAIYEVLGWPEPPAPDGILEESIGGHVNILAAHPFPAGGAVTNTLIWFSGPEAERPLETLDRALERIRRRDFALTIVIVLPRGTFAGRRREIEERLGFFGETSRGTLRGNAIALREGHLPVRLSVTEDYAGGWSRLFRAEGPQSIHLVNARGEFVWKHEGRLNPDSLGAALDEHLSPSRLRPPLPLRLAVQPGEQAPDATFADDQGSVLALRRLRGRRVLLTFWQSWSAPCLKELHLLQRLHEEGGKRPPAIVAINGGEDSRIIEEVRRQHKFTIPLVPDPDQQIARLYGIACWPTTVSINEGGIVNRVQFGISHQHPVERRLQTA